MIAAASSDGSSWGSLTISSAERPARSAAPAFGPELAQRLHREPAVALDQQRERGLPVLVGELGEELREIGRMLLLEQIDEVRRRPHAQEALDGVEHDVELALRHGSRVATNGNCPM